MRKRICKALGLHLAVFAVLAAYIIIFQGKCPFRLITGIPCAGCGLTRAWLSVFDGAIERAMVLHPLFWLAPIAVWTPVHLRIVLPRLPKWATPVSAMLLAVPFLAVYIARMAAHSIL